MNFQFVTKIAALLFLLMLCSTRLHAQVSLPVPDKGVGELITILESDGPIFEKAKACQQLAIIGNADAVPALAALLPDEQLSTYARSALEAIPAAESDDALREAAKTLKGHRLVGVLHSIGKRRNTQSTALLAELLTSEDQTVQNAAARALGEIGTPAAANVLKISFSEASGQLRLAIAQGCLHCAQRLADDEELQQAASLCNLLHNAKLPQNLHWAATYTAITSQGAAGTPLLLEMLDSGDPAQFLVAIQAARQVGDTSDLATELASRLEGQSAENQTLLLGALGDLGDDSVLPTVLKAAKHKATEVRIAAIEALSRLGNESCATLLLEAAADDDEDVAGAAQAAIAQLEGDIINTAVVAMLDSDQPQTVRSAVEMASKRSIAAATPILLRLAKEKDASIRHSSIQALGRTATLTHLPDLIDLTIDTLPSGDSTIVRLALKSACVRMPQEECGAAIVAAMPNVPSDVRVVLLEQLAVVGGTTAREAVVDAAKSHEDAMQDAGTRLLGGWLTADAAPAMLELSKTLTNGKYQIRALRGYIRIARQLDMTIDERMEVCRNALAIANRDDERRLVLDVLRRHPASDGLGMAETLAGIESLREPSCATIVSIAGSVAMEYPKMAEAALKRVLELTTDPAVRADVEKAMVVVRDALSLKLDEAAFTSLFDGVSLKGWKQPGRVFRVKDRAIVGGSLEKAIGKGNDYLCLEGDYDNFELRLEARIKGTDFPNGGIHIRSSHTQASGYQADLGPEYYGCLYDEVRRHRMLAFANPKQKIPTGQWVAYRIRCEGPRIRIWINGTQTVDYTEEEPGIAKAGAIGLQSHANRASETWYRNIRIRKL